MLPNNKPTWRNLWREDVPYHIRLRRFYGVAWHDFMRRKFVSYPVPIHLLARLVRWCWWQIIKHRPDEIEKRTLAAYHVGYGIGFTDGVDSEKNNLYASCVRCHTIHPKFRFHIGQLMMTLYCEGCKASTIHEPVKVIHEEK